MAEENDDLFGLEFNIDGFEELSITTILSMSSQNAFIIYLKVENKTSQSRKINLLKAIYVTNKREQLEQDNWLTGYMEKEDLLKPNSFKKAGLIFYKSKLKTISDNDVIYISIELSQEGGKLNLCFKKTGNNWLLINTVLNNFIRI